MKSHKAPVQPHLCLVVCRLLVVTRDVLFNGIQEPLEVFCAPLYVQRMNKMKCTIWSSLFCLSMSRFKIWGKKIIYKLTMCCIVAHCELVDGMFSNTVVKLPPKK